MSFLNEVPASVSTQYIATFPPYPPLPYVDSALQDVQHAKYDQRDIGSGIQSQQLDCSKLFDDTVGFFDFITSLSPSQASNAGSGSPQTNCSLAAHHSTASHATSSSGTERSEATPQRSSARQAHLQDDRGSVGAARSMKPKRSRKHVPYEAAVKRKGIVAAEGVEPGPSEKRPSNAYFVFLRDYRPALADPGSFALSNNLLLRIMGKMWYLISPEKRDYYDRLSRAEQNPAPEDSVAYKFHHGTAAFKVVSVPLVLEAMRILIRCCVDRVFDPNLTATRVSRKRFTKESAENALHFAEEREELWKSWKEWLGEPVAALPPLFSPEDAFCTAQDLRPFGLVVGSQLPLASPSAVLPAMSSTQSTIRLPVMPTMPNFAAPAFATPDNSLLSYSHTVPPVSPNIMALLAGYSTPVIW
ncbi:uncharacterized protein PHACADRAFT_209855 [Phanerochaete carnosa HHB-10118-sp]|uniref:HMG box domain-containing protein n=1 Tax=Phanerochaete carnosa (strain HHB-10118-sp) TaxID=650164 RepID=K5W4D7_PHACS|nr:uncharacterized protein PHACADRAFT_209855 [Phanerochaete carnosa HHB-10118-sp]EKM54025.1 hypothetical protein PHACADRAFT_209855 [Phanerochaete carnosa HHB-10118-sp]